MKPVSLRDDTLEMEELELKGQETENKKNPRPKNGLSRLTLVHFACSFLYFTPRYHWPNGVVPYVIDAAFTTTERASIAEGITHIHENSCVRYSGGDQDCIYLIFQVWRKNRRGGLPGDHTWGRRLLRHHPVQVNRSSTILLSSLLPGQGRAGTRSGSSRTAASPWRLSSMSYFMLLASSMNRAGPIDVVLSHVILMNTMISIPDALNVAGFKCLLPTR